MLQARQRRVVFARGLTLQLLGALLVPLLLLVAQGGPLGANQLGHLRHADLGPRRGGGDRLRLGRLPLLVAEQHVGALAPPHGEARVSSVGRGRAV